MKIKILSELLLLLKLFPHMPSANKRDWPMHSKDRRRVAKEILRPLSKAAALKRGLRAMRHQKSKGALLLQLQLLQQLSPHMPSATKWDWPMHRRDQKSTTNEIRRPLPKAAALKRGLRTIMRHQKGKGALLLQLLLQWLFPHMPSATKWEWPMHERGQKRTTN